MLCSQSGTDFAIIQFCNNKKSGLNSLHVSEEGDCYNVKKITNDFVGTQ